MNFLKKFLIRGLYGIPLGVFISQAISVIYALIYPNDIPSNIIVTQFFIASLFGFYCSAISTIFEVDTWSLLKQTVIHFICCSVVYFPVAMFAGWIPKGINNPIFIQSFISFIIIYCIVWFSFKSYWKAKAKEINKELKKLN